jgi:hypothetical protein
MESPGKWWCAQKKKSLLLLLRVTSLRKLKQAQAPLLIPLLGQSPFELPPDISWIKREPVLCRSLA